MQFSRIITSYILQVRKLLTPARVCILHLMSNVYSSKEWKCAPSVRSPRNVFREKQNVFTEYSCRCSGGVSPPVEDEDGGEA